jgi:hypothetical protein
MELDIRKYKLIHPNDIQNDKKYEKFHFTEEYENNKSIANFINQYSDYIQHETVERANFRKKFEEMGLNYDDYGWLYYGDKIAFCTKEFYESEKFINFSYYKENEENKFFPHVVYLTFEECEQYLIEIKFIYHTPELDYQRKGISNDFIFEDEVDGICFVYSNEKLEEIKKYAEEDAIIKSWILNEKEFIVFDW